MLKISHVTTQDLPTLVAMISKLCAFHGDPCLMDVAEAKTKFIDGPLISFIASDGPSPIGYIVLEPHWRPMHQGDLLDIAHLFVEEPMRGRGVGKALIARAQDYARTVNAHKLTIGTSPENPNAASAYRAMGFTEITMQPGPRFEIPL